MRQWPPFNSPVPGSRSIHPSPTPNQPPAADLWFSGPSHNGRDKQNPKLRNRSISDLVGRRGVQEPPRVVGLPDPPAVRACASDWRAWRAWRLLRGPADVAVPNHCQPEQKPHQNIHRRRAIGGLKPCRAAVAKALRLAALVWGLRLR